MAIVLFCRWKGCGYRHESELAEVPATCPECHRSGHWASDPPPVPKADSVGDHPNPSAGYALTFNDARLLKSLRIDPEIPPPPSETDAA